MFAADTVRDLPIWDAVTPFRVLVFLVVAGVLYGMMRLLFKLAARSAVTGKRLSEGSVRGVTGLMGHGKSTFVALYVVRPWLKRGRTVVTNFGVEPDVQGFKGSAVLLSSASFLEDLLGIGVGGSFVDTGCRCSRHCSEHVSVTECGALGCPRYKRRLRCSCEGVKVIIDEAAVFVPANGAMGLPMELKSWITLTRKNHIEVCWLAQSHKDVHAMLRRLTQEYWECVLDTGGMSVAQRFPAHAGEPGREPSHSMRFAWSPLADGMFNSWEIILPARDALEMVGKLSGRYLAELEVSAEMRRRAAGRRASEARAGAEAPAPGDTVAPTVAVPAS